MASFVEMLRRRWEADTFVCVGLDSDVTKIPKCVTGSVAQRVSFFNREIIAATADLVCAYKPNIAFYEAMGAEGMDALFDTIEAARVLAPGVPVILDAKRADIDNTNNGYVTAAFDELGADAITVHPYLGSQAMKPFLDRKDQGVIVLCRTSNKGAGEFQDRPTFVSWKELEELNLVDVGTLTKTCGWQELPSGMLMPMYHYVALIVMHKWNTNGNCALVAGATYPEELSMLRFLAGDLPFLIPGIGAQGGDVEKTVKAGVDLNGQGVVINSSRGIIFASQEADFADVARQETLKLNQTINDYRRL